jgi:4'-phosphopantetheinyl transferase
VNRLFSIHSGTQIWIARFSDYYLQTEELKTLLSNEEKARSARFHFNHDRDKFIISRGLLRTYLGRLLGENPKSLNFTCNEFGKPKLSGSHATIEFNLSHSGDFVIYAFSKDEVGIDIEYIRPDFEPSSLVSHLFSADESLQYFRLPDSLRIPAFFWSWTRKESFVKALGKGLTFPLQQIAISVLPKASDRPSYIVQNFQTYAIYDIEVPSAPYALSVCCKF